MRLQKILSILTVTIFMGVVQGLAAQNWQIDYSRSSLGFVVDSRLGEVPGVFHKWKFDGNIVSDTNVQGKIIVDVSSIDTENQKRDDHLRDPDFFEVEKYPTAEFQIESIEKKSNKYTVKGNLQIIEQTKPLEFDLKVKNSTADSMTLKALFFVNRQDLGLTYDSFLNPIEDQVVIRIELVLKK